MVRRRCHIHHTITAICLQQMSHRTTRRGSLRVTRLSGRSLIPAVRSPGSTNLCTAACDHRHKHSRLMQLVFLYYSPQSFGCCSRKTYGRDQCLLTLHWCLFLHLSKTVLRSLQSFPLHLFLPRHSLMHHFPSRNLPLSWNLIPLLLNRPRQ